jgi:hypothetical protein
VTVYGLVADKDQREFVAAEGLKALQNAVAKKLIPGPVQVVNTLKMVVGSTDFDRLLALKSICPVDYPRLVRVQYYAPRTGEIDLTGVVESARAPAQLRALVESLPVVGKVDVSEVIVADPEEVRGGMLASYNRAMAALGQGSGQELVTAATEVIRAGKGGSRIEANAWFLRGAGHLLLNQRRKAVGDLRVAALLEEKLPGTSYHEALERFQGSGRKELQELLRLGPRSSLAPTLSNQR